MRGVKIGNLVTLQFRSCYLQKYLRPQIVVRAGSLPKTGPHVR